MQEIRKLLLNWLVLRSFFHFYHGFCTGIAVWQSVSRNNYWQIPFHPKVPVLNFLTLNNGITARTESLKEFVSLRLQQFDLNLTPLPLIENTTLACEPLFLYARCTFQSTSLTFR